MAPPLFFVHFQKFRGEKPPPPPKESDAKQRLAFVNEVLSDLTPRIFGGGGGFFCLEIVGN